MKFCQYCGKELTGRGKCTCSDAVAEQKKFQKIAVIASAVALAVVILIVIMASALSAGSGSDNLSSDGSSNGGASSVGMVDAFDYVTITFDGYEGQGKIEYSFKKDRLIYQVLGDDPENEKELAEWIARLQAYEAAIQYECDYTENLSNGDTVTVTITVTGVAKNSIKGGTKTYTVSGLIELETVDVFDGVKVSFEGTSGSGRVVIQKPDSPEFMSDCDFAADNQFSLSNGDTVTIRVTDSSMRTLNEDYNVMPKETSKEFKVSGLQSHAVSVTQLPIADIEEFANIFYLDRLANLQPDSEYNYENIEYEGTYFYVSNGNGYGWDRPYKTILKITVSYDYYVLRTYMGKRTSCLYFTDILADSDGNVSLTYEDAVYSIDKIDESCYDITPITITIKDDGTT